MGENELGQRARQALLLLVVADQAPGAETGDLVEEQLAGDRRREDEARHRADEDLHEEKVARPPDVGVLLVFGSHVADRIEADQGADHADREGDQHAEVVGRHAPDRDAGDGPDGLAEPLPSGRPVEREQRHDGRERQDRRRDAHVSGPPHWRDEHERRPEERYDDGGEQECRHHEVTPPRARRRTRAAPPRDPRR